MPRKEELVDEYLEKFRDRFNLGQDCLEEMKDHLFSQIDYSIESGKPLDEACQSVFERFGSTESIRKEFEKIYIGDNVGQIKNFFSYYFESNALRRMGIGALLGGLIFWAIAEMSGTGLGSFISLKPLMFVIGLVSILTFSGIPLPLLKGKNIPALIHHVTHFGGQNSILVGFWGMIAGLVMMLAYWSTPQKIGPNLAFAINCVLYGSLLRIFVFDALKNVVKTDDSHSSFYESDWNHDYYRFWAGLAVAWGALTGSLYFIGGIVMFWDVISLVFVLGFSICPVLVRFGGNLKEAFATVTLCGRPKKDEKKVFESMSFAALYSGVICTIIGFVVIFSNMDDPNKITPGLAVAILSMLYGFAGYYTWKNFSVMSEFYGE